MEEKKSTENSKRRQVREPPSVPFLWEVQPGIPIKNWKPEVSPVIQVPAPPVKLIASVPFIWEEKPGKPLPRFIEQQVESTSPIHTSKAHLPNITPAYSFPWDTSDGDNDKEGSSDGVYDDGGYSYDKEWASQLDLDTLSWETDESFSSVPSLLANCLVPSATISTAIPTESNSDQLEAPNSPTSQTSSCTSSYATGSSSVIGASFLERLFPLFPPNSGFLGKVQYSENDTLTPAEPKSKDPDHENNSSVGIRRPPTLGELIMMSRRRSYRRKALQMRKSDLSMEMIMKNSFGCCMFQTGGKTIETLYGRRKCFPRLKLM